ncbi:Aldehyde dehydrogenase [Forsythia ovata]|uniref:aldehyde dehydrogenase (NAD(+)) n=1 Tax=Forsythia ovata TaxID=205694 RepID=A0ABD1PUY3_9LAMI
MALEAAELVAGLRATFGSGKTKSYEWRVSQLKAIVKLADERQKDIIGALRSDLNKPEFESYAHEISGVKKSCNLALKELHWWMTPEKAKTSSTTFPSSAEIVSEPLGVILVISTWNYPFLLSLDPVVGAISAGNTVVLKPSEIAPATSSLLSELLGEYMDSSAVKVVEGAVPETTALLEQKWDKILYTGSCEVGRIILAAAAKHLTPVILELGGKCPVVVDTNVNLEVAARRIIAGKWSSNNGQTCVAPDYVITTKAFAPKLVDALTSELEKFYGKEPLKSQDLSRIVNSSHFNRLTKLMDDEKVSGKIVHGGQCDKTNLRIAPTILLDVPEDSLIMNEEIFGPLLPIITVNKIEDSINVINAREKPLAAYLFTNDKKLKEEFIGSISAGGLCINDTTLHLAESSLPFGGVGESGMGSYHGKFSFDAFSHKKAVLRRSFAGDISARYPPYTTRKLQLLKALLNGSILGILRALFDGNQLKNVARVKAQSLTSSYYFLVEGDGLEKGFFHAAVRVGNRLNEFYLEIDTGSDLTWITCSPTNIQFLKTELEKHFTRCLQPFSTYKTPHNPYKTNNNFVSCEDSSTCGLVEKPVNPQCSKQNQQCHYQVEYADHGSSLGVLVRDIFFLSSSSKGSLIQPISTLIFGCGYHQEFSPLLRPPFADGVLGLGTGKTSILSQLSGQGLIKKVMALCLSEMDPGYLVLGDSQSNLPRIIWMPLSNNHLE